MTIKVAFHVIQAFPHCCLNRDKEGMPKTGGLGDVRRIEVSSACSTRATRDYFVEHQLLEAGELAFRTKDILARVAERMVQASPALAMDRARRAVSRALDSLKLKTDPLTGESEALMLLPRRLVGELSDLILPAIDGLAAAGTPPEAPPAEADDPKKAGKAATGAKRKAKEAAAEASGVGPELRAKLEAAFSNAARTPEAALFGTFFADHAAWCMHAAAQRAWWVSTHAADIGFDFFTGLADDRPKDKQGAEMTNNTPFAAGACFYRYIAINVDRLVANLGGDDAAREQGRRSLAAYLRAAALSIPSGKENSMAAHCLPNFMMLDVRAGEAPSLVNAFSVPVYPTGEAHGGVIDKSVLRLAEHLREHENFFGAKRRDLGFAVIDPAGTLAPAFVAKVPAAKHRTGSGDRPAIDILIEEAVAAAFRPA